MFHKMSTFMLHTVTLFMFHTACQLSLYNVSVVIFHKQFQHPFFQRVSLFIFNKGMSTLIEHQASMVRCVNISLFTSQKMHVNVHVSILIFLNVSQRSFFTLSHCSWPKRHVNTHWTQDINVHVTNVSLFMVQKMYVNAHMSILMFHDVSDVPQCDRVHTP